MVVQHNISAMTANRYYQVNNSSLGKSLEKLASGYSINRAGDNAAGLAVSEKMRAQIGGLTQASKNAEDGISMVQTFEGALQETDSILQRMRTLAVQSANGSYQDDVDREAMQLEFDQLNDELNQIADTDYNGTVVLNGGVMADGLKAVDGKFDYANYKRDSKQLASSDVTLLDSQNWNDTDVANTAWKALNASWNRTDALTRNDGPESVDVTFEYDASGGASGDKFWKATSITGGADLTKITPLSTGATAGTKNGGFDLQINSVSVGKVVLDQTQLANGDKITLTISNPKNGQHYATNGGAEMVSNSFNEKSGDDDFKLKDIDLGVTVTDNTANNSKMTENDKRLYDSVNGGTYSVNYTNKTVWAAGDFNLKFALNDDDNTVITNLDDGFHKMTVNIDGKATEIAYQFTSESGKLEIGTANADGSDFGTKLVTLTPDKAQDDKSTSTGTADFKVSIENYQYDAQSTPTIEIKEPGKAEVSVSNAFNQSKATMTYADSMSLQVGARTKDEVNFTFRYASNGLGDLKANMNCSARTDGLGTADLSIADQKSANAAIDKIDNAINKISMVRGTFGAIQNRLEHKINNIDTNTENLTAAESRIRDTQMDKEMMKFTSSQILSQASQSMLAQANQLPQGVLQLLG